MKGAVNECALIVNHVSLLLPLDDVQGTRRAFSIIPLKRMFIQRKEEKSFARAVLRFAPTSMLASVLYCYNTALSTTNNTIAHPMSSTNDTARSESTKGTAT